MKNIKVANQQIEIIFDKVSQYIDNARNNIIKSVDNEMVSAYWLIGRDIVEEEQNWQELAKYGSYILSELSTRLTIKYGKGFSISTLKDIRRFYLVFQDYAPDWPRSAWPIWQRRLTLDGDHFYADLVFYHTKLKCYVVIDLLCGA